jgi:hypothetical protein
MMSIELATGEGRLAIKLTGMHTVYALEGGLEIPLDTITDDRRRKWAAAGYSPDSDSAGSTSGSRPS